MTVWFVSRHPGALDWARDEGIAVDKCAAHLDVTQVRAGDQVIAALPVHLAAQVCARGARYLHLQLLVPAELRGVELSAAQMRQCGATIKAYRVTEE